MADAMDFSDMTARAERIAARLRELGESID